jgi:hypothetical protein
VLVVFRAGSGLCDKPISRLEGSYRQCLCELETSSLGPSLAVKPQNKIPQCKQRQDLNWRKVSVWSNLFCSYLLSNYVILYYL